MCGIIGLMIKKPERRHELGAWMKPMFTCMAERGPDSGGMAVFGTPIGSARRYSLFADEDNYDWRALFEAFKEALARRGADDAEILPLDNHAILISSVTPGRLSAWLAECDPSPRLLSVGRRIDLFKDEGPPGEIADRYRFEEMTGSHCVGHTRMATESRVSPAHSHPFTAGEDFCLVHNGSLSNPYMLRRKLERQGLRFETDNDTEAACRYIEWRMRQGDDLEEALRHGLEALDGFFTLLIGTVDRLTLVRDTFGCKPAVIAETDDCVAIASEFRSLAHLPGIGDAHVFEPKPEEIYSWKL